MNSKGPLRLVAIVGGSGAGKTWLAERLRQALGSAAARLSLDNFYRDRSHLSLKRRARVNFDHPRAIDWPCVERVLRDCRAGRATRVPRYDFGTHARLASRRFWQPKVLILMEGLWLLRRPTVRRFFDLRIFVDCPTRLRLQRRLARDVVQRGRTRSSVHRQFRETVAPLHERFVAPQARWADIVFKRPPQEEDVHELAAKLRTLLNSYGRNGNSSNPNGFPHD
jgi:uridine kinase